MKIIMKAARLSLGMPFRDRVRTSINVLGDAFGAGIVNHLTKEKLPPKVDVEVAPFGGQQRFSIITEDNGCNTPQTISKGMANTGMPTLE